MLMFENKTRREMLDASLSWGLGLVLLLCGYVVLVEWQAVWVILGFVVFFLYLLPIVRFKDPFRAPPWEIVLLITIPAVIHVLSGTKSFGQIGGAWADVAAIADSFGLATLGFLIVAELEMYTAFRTNRPFAAVFVVLFTMAVAGWAFVVEFIAALLYGQEPEFIFGTNDKIMGFFVYTFIIGILMGVIYAVYVGLMSVQHRMSYGFEKPDKSDQKVRP